MSHPIYSKYLEQFKIKYPKTSKSHPIENMVSGKLISPFTLELPKSILEQATTAYSLLHKVLYSEDTAKHETLKEKHNPGVGSLLTCLDFHLNESNQLKLIEINTNASLYLVGDLLTEVTKNTSFENRLDNLANNFKAASDYGKDIFILDENPENEFLYFEFLMFQEWLETLGYNCKIISLKEINNLSKQDLPDLIYNRYCDFYLNDEVSKTLRAWYEAGDTKFSPHPFAYDRLANKQRLVTLCDFTFLNTLQGSDKTLMQSLIPITKKLDPSQGEELWQERKKFIFKPANSFGSKAVYRGNSVSRKKFAELLQEDNYLVQEMIPPPKTSFAYDNKNYEFKYDLRFFGFEGEIQFALARLYQGQITNFRTDLGGTACIRWT